ncbi:MAG: hypothetical protein HP492_00590 [Nitrospira sp.]|nr:hypothetical protein [Nitrospira sp.]
MEILVYLVPILVALGVYAWRRNRMHHRSLRAHHEAKSAGLTEPASLHPVVDPLKWKIDKLVKSGQTIDANGGAVMIS